MCMVLRCGLNCTDLHINTNTFLGVASDLLVEGSAPSAYSLLAYSRKRNQDAYLRCFFGQRQLKDLDYNRNRWLLD